MQQNQTTIPTDPTAPNSPEIVGEVLGIATEAQGQLPNEGIDVYTSEDPSVGEDVKGVAEKIRTNACFRDGRLSAQDLDPDGIFRDEYSEQSTHFLVNNGDKVSSGRQIDADETGEGVRGLPTFKKFSYDPQEVAEMANVTDFDDLQADEVVEISAISSIAKDGSAYENDRQTNLEATPFLYTQMLRRSMERGHKLWVANMPQWLIDDVSQMIGPEQIRQIGEPEEHYREEAIPVALNPRSIVETVLTSDLPHIKFYQKYIKEVFKGLDASKLDEQFQEILEGNGILTARKAGRNFKLLMQ